LFCAFDHSRPTSSQINSLLSVRHIFFDFIAPVHDPNISILYRSFCHWDCSWHPKIQNPEPKSGEQKRRPSSVKHSTFWSNPLHQT